MAPGAPGLRRISVAPADGLSGRVSATAQGEGQHEDDQGQATGGHGQGLQGIQAVTVLLPDQPGPGKDDPGKDGLEAHAAPLAPAQGRPAPVEAVAMTCLVGGQLKAAAGQLRIEELAGLLGQHRALYLYQTENALVLVRDRQAALVGDVCSEWEASRLVRLLRCEGIDRLELLLCTSPTTDDSAGIDLLLEEIDAKAAVIPPGNFTPHIRQALGGQLIPSGQGVGAQLLGDVQLQFDRNGVQLHAGDKKLLKTGRSYGIIEQDPNGWDAVLDSDGWQLRDKQGMTLVWTLEQQPALRVKL